MEHSRRVSFFESSDFFPVFFFRILLPRVVPERHVPGPPRGAPSARRSGQNSQKSFSALSIEREGRNRRLRILSIFKSWYASNLTENV